MFMKYVHPEDDPIRAAAEKVSHRRLPRAFSDGGPLPSDFGRDLARDLRGLDAVMNDSSRFLFACTAHPLTPKNLVDYIVSFGRQSCLKALIVSWMVRSPDFEHRVAALRAIVKTRVDVSEADLDRLLNQLRSIP